jgi:TRAP-type C4-dicarboxylate transport system permease small subunit
VALSVLTLVAAALIGLAQVTARVVLETPMPWSEPVVRTLLIWMVYLGICEAIRSGSLVAVDVVYGVVPPAVRTVMSVVILTSSLCFFAILGWFGLEMVKFVQNQTLAGVGISISWSYAAIPAGSILALISLVANFLATVIDGNHTGLAKIEASL